MTFIKPKNDRDLLNIALVLMIIIAFGGAWKVIALNNKLVDFNHDVLILKNNLAQLEKENTESRIRIFSFLDKLRSQSFDMAETRGLVQEKNPQYFKIDKKWLFASHY